MKVLRENLVNGDNSEDLSDVDFDLSDPKFDMDLCEIGRRDWADTNLWAHQFGGQLPSLANVRTFLLSRDSGHEVVDWKSLTQDQKQNLRNTCSLIDGDIWIPVGVLCDYEFNYVQIGNSALYYPGQSMVHDDGGMKSWTADIK